METKMKKIPFDLKLAKQGVAFYIHVDRLPSVWVADDGIGMLAKFFNNNRWVYISFDIKNLSNTYHLILEEPKKKRWAVVYKQCIFSTEDEADQCIDDKYNPDSYSAFKISDNE